MNVIKVPCSENDEDYTTHAYCFVLLLVNAWS